jgi:hypothetical protein
MHTVACHQTEGRARLLDATAHRVGGSRLQRVIKHQTSLLGEGESELVKIVGTTPHLVSLLDVRKTSRNPDECLRA